MNVIGLILLFTMAVLAGLTMYAYYETCDPLKSGCVARPDQVSIIYVYTFSIYLFPWKLGAFFFFIL